MTPTIAQEAAAPETSTATVADDPVAAIPGIWIRDERLSEDPIEKLEETYGQTFGGGPVRSPGANPGSGRSGGFGRGGFGRGRPGGPPGGTQDGPSGMREMARELAERLDVLLIRIDDPQLLIRNAKREDRILYLDGRDIADGFGGHSRARLLGDSLEVETSSQGRQRIETFYLEGNQLVLVTDLQGGRFADLSFRTVYERSGDAPAVAVPTSASRAPEAAAEPDDDGFDKADFLPPVAGGRDGSRAERADGARSARPATIRILPPERGYRELLAGRVLIQTLTIDPQIAVVEFLLDGEPAARVTTPPFEARIRLADPPREQTIEARATSARGAHAGADRIVLNRLDPPFAVRIAGITPGEADGQAMVRVEAGISVPRSEALERVEFYRTERLVASYDDFEGEAGPSGVQSVAADVPTFGVTPQDFVRVVARLGDGRELEDVELLQGAQFQAEIDVQLVQLQVLVVDRGGNPVGDLKPEDFEVRENGERRQVEKLYVSNDIPLSLGLAIDSSGSMEPIWRQTNAIAEAFLDGALTWRDQAFLVDFDSTLRLVQPLTGSKPLLARGLGRLFPQGNTALYDAILFSLLQYGEAPGRRALVVVTDGFDSNSRSDPTRAIDFGKRLGVPVYVVAMRSLGFGPTTMEDANLRNSMRLITGPTGGRLFQIESIDQMAAVFDHIEEELRRQYVLTYYSARPFGSAVEPEVRMTRRGLRVRSALPLEAIE
ncbi:MAG: VWA domain-containing protein [Holophagales bacterium]|nr:VWA domain-containing protein [Holophagales bacterium]